MVDRKELDRVYKELLEEKIIEYLANKKAISIRQAMDIYYRSKLAQMIYEGTYGIENMDYRYLVEDLIENEPELFTPERVSEVVAETT